MEQQPILDIIDENHPQYPNCSAYQRDFESGRLKELGLWEKFIAYFEGDILRDKQGNIMAYDDIDGLCNAIEEDRPEQDISGYLFNQVEKEESEESSPSMWHIELQ